MLAGPGHQQGSEVVRRCGKQGAQEGEAEGGRTGGKGGSHTQLMGSRASGKSCFLHGSVCSGACVPEVHDGNTLHPCVHMPVCARRLSACLGP